MDQSFFIKVKICEMSGLAYPSGAPELLIVFVEGIRRYQRGRQKVNKGSCYSGFSFQCSVVCSMFVFCFILLAVVLSVYRLDDFCLPIFFEFLSFHTGYPCQSRKCIMINKENFTSLDGTWGYVLFPQILNSYNIVNIAWTNRSMNSEWPKR